MQTTQTTIADIKTKLGKSDKGPWELATITGSDGKKYKTFDTAITEKAKKAMGSTATVEISFDETNKTYENKDGKPVPYVDRTIKDLVIKNGAPPPAAGGQAHAAAAGPASTVTAQSTALEFERQASIAALKACTDVMTACLAGAIETYKFDDAMRIVKTEAKALYATYFKSKEGGSSHGDDFATDDHQEAEIVE